MPQVTAVVSLEYEGYLREWTAPWFKREGVSDKIDVRIGDGQAELKQLAHEGQKFDAAFIDADKPSYPAYFRMLLDLDLLAPGGVIYSSSPGSVFV